jgi:hypothetical protein
MARGILGIGWRIESGIDGKYTYLFNKISIKTQVSIYVV